jgi:Zn-dependent protease with chaperone function
MRSQAEAHYYPEQTAKRQVVEVQATPAGLEFRDESGIARRWAYDEIRFPGAIGARDPLRFEHDPPPGETLVVRDPRFLDAVYALAPQTRGRFVRITAPKNRWVGAIAVIAIAAAILVVYLAYRALPILAERAVAFIPMSWEQRLGEMAVEQIAPPGNVCADSTLAAELDAILHRLLSAEDPPLDVRLRVVRADHVNAFAFPGGQVVVFTGLLNATETPEQFAGVLAHELQHVRHRHGTKALLRQLSASALLSLIAGDSGALSSVLRTAGELGGLAYGRDDEHEADRDGARMLIAAGVDPRGMIEFFETLEELEGEGVALTFLSTHPATGDRVRALEQAIADASGSAAAGAAPARAYAPIATSVSWSELGKRCANP